MKFMLLLASSSSFLARRIPFKPAAFIRYTSTMSTAAPTTLIIEQTNVLEKDPSQFQYKTTLGNCSFNDFILSYPSGAYTGMRTVHRDAIVEFNTHMTRMTNSLSMIQFEGKTASQTQAANDALASLRDPVGFEAKVIPLLRKGLTAYYDQVDATTHTEHPSEAKVSLMATYSFETQQPYFAAHFAALPTIPPNKRVKVEIERKERKAPEVKDSQWVRDRQSLEKNKPVDVNEVLLMDDQERLYEGMASNFLVVKDGAVVCASLDHILLGSILKIVIKVCKEHAIPLKWEFPTLQDGKQGKWEGCFLTSTSRLLLPIETILVDNQR
ncbi:aminotransferase [Mucor lusitanicus]|uniref:Aminotransferase n=1 Tax=Mucor circinelloides f. lusitanicus TaxID=29924 RepID=A0A8H4BPV2_MUCCL|nr:aminotransferase [Mucor lusitanicus]